MTDELLQTLRTDPNVNLLRPVLDDRFSDTDFYRMIAAVEESNAEFEGFCFRDFPERPDTLLGYPVQYSDAVNEGEAFGGMWSDVDEDGNPKHGAAFVCLKVRGE